MREKAKLFPNFSNKLETPGENEDKQNNLFTKKIPLRGYLTKRKWYGQKISNPFSAEEINEALRSQKENKSVGMGQVPSGIFKIFRTKWVEILKTYSKKYMMEI